MDKTTALLGCLVCNPPSGMQRDLPDYAPEQQRNAVSPHARDGSAIGGEGEGVVQKKSNHTQTFSQLEAF